MGLTALDRFVADPVLGPAFGRTRGLLAMTKPLYRLTMTLDPWPNRPWFAVMPTLAPWTWRSPAWPRRCQVSSQTWAIAWAGTASPKQAKPPEAFTGTR